MYQAPSPAFATGCNCPAGPHRTMPLIQRLFWNPRYPATCQTCGATLVRRRAMLFFGWVPALLILSLLLASLFWSNVIDGFFDHIYVFVPLIFGLQLINAWLEFRFSPITVKVDRA